MPNSSFFGRNPSVNDYEPSYVTNRVTNYTGSGTINVDWSNTDTFRLHLTGNATLTFSGAIDGQKCLLEIIQDATGGRTVTFPDDIAYSSNLPSALVSTAANKRDKQGYIYNSSAAKYDLVAVMTGY